jgi:hypothetical protein
VSIEQDAQQDLSLTDQDAEGVAGGKKTKKTAAKHKASGASVPYIKVPGFTGTPDSTLPESDCEPDDASAT